MAPSVVVELNPVGDGTNGMLLALEALPIYTLPFQCADQVINHLILLRRMRRDEFLPQPIGCERLHCSGCWRRRVRCQIETGRA